MRVIRLVAALSLMVIALVSGTLYVRHRISDRRDDETTQRWVQSATSPSILVAGTKPGLAFENRTKQKLSLYLRASVSGGRVELRNDVAPTESSFLGFDIEKKDEADYEIEVIETSAQGSSTRTELSWHGKPKGTRLAYTPEGQIVWLKAK